MGIEYGVVWGGVAIVLVLTILIWGMVRETSRERRDRGG